MCLHFTSRSLCPVQPVEKELLCQPVKKESPSVLSVPLQSLLVDQTSQRIPSYKDLRFKAPRLQPNGVPCPEMEFHSSSFYYLHVLFFCSQIIFLPSYYPLSAPASNKCSKEPSPGSLGQQQKKMQPFQKAAPISSSVFSGLWQRTVQSPASSPFPK